MEMVTLAPVLTRCRDVNFPEHLHVTVQLGIQLKVFFLKASCLHPLILLSAPSQPIHMSLSSLCSLKEGVEVQNQTHRTQVMLSVGDVMMFVVVFDISH